jgi:RNA polymerase sigma factor (sigma-70 family)
MKPVPPSSEFPLESLRRLARGVLFEPGLAEDAVQEAWILALERGGHVERPTGWLHGVVRRLSWNRRRDEALRGARELRAARPEALPGTAEVLGRVEVLRRLLDAVEALEEPYRTAIGMRFLDELPPREIARRTGQPVNTVRTHLRRGLSRLRRVLDPGDERGREDFLAALVPFAGAVPLQPIPVAPGSVATGLVAAAGVALVGLVGWRLWSGDEEAPRGSAGETSVVATPAGPEPGAPAVAAALGVQESAREPVPPTESFEASWVLRGHVTRGSYEAFPDAPLVGRVEDLESDGASILETRFHTDAQGDFSWALEAPTTWTRVSLQVDLPDEVGEGSWAYFVPGDAPLERWKISARLLDTTVTGTVRDQEGAPVAGALIVQQYFDVETRAGSDGRYTIRAPSSHSSGRLRVIADGFAQATIELGELAPDATTTRDAVLEPERRLRGAVRDPQGTPVEGAAVTAGYPFDRVPGATTDGAGRFELGSVPMQVDPITLLAQAPGWRAASLRVSLDLDPEALELVLLEPGVRISGRVLSPEGEPVPRAYVRLGQFPWGEPAEDEKTWSDVEGRFELAGVAPGACYLWVQRSGFVHQRHEVQVPGEGDTLEGVDLELERGHTLAGVVLDAQDHPMPWCMVYADAGLQPVRLGTGPRPIPFGGAQVWTGADGRFRLEDLPDLRHFAGQRITIGALAGGHARLEVEVTELDREDLVLRPQASGALAGRVVDAQTGEPVTHFRVTPSLSPGSSSDARVTYPSSWRSGIPIESADGVWRLGDDFPAGVGFRVEIEADGYAPLVIDPVVSAADPEATLMPLVRSTLVRGRVIDAATGTPVEDAVVRVLHSEIEARTRDGSQPQARTDVRGDFELGDVPSGQLLLVVEHPGHVLTFDGPFQVGAASVTRTIELGGGGRIEGRLLAADGSPLAGEQVALFPQDGPEALRERGTTTSALGGFFFDALFAGSYHLSWRHEIEGVAVNDLSRPLQLEANQSLRDVVLRPTGQATVRGTIAFEGPLPAPVRLSLRRAPRPGDEGSSTGGRATVSTDGTFEVTHLEAGDWALSAMCFTDEGHLWRGDSFTVLGTYLAVPEQGTVDIAIPLTQVR